VVAQAQRTDAAVVVDREQVVQLGQRRQGRVVPAAPGVLARDDAPPPGVRRGVGDGAVEDRVLRRRRLARLVAWREPQVGRDVEPESDS